MSDANKFDAIAFVRDAAKEVARLPDPVGVIREKVQALWDADRDGDAMAVYDELQRLGAQRAIALARLEAAHSAPIKKGQTRGPVAAVSDGTLAIGSPDEWELPNGSRLSAASVADLDDAIARHKTKALAHIGWVKFYGDVRAKMLSAKVHTVADLFKERDLLAIGVEYGVGNSEA